MIIKKIIPRALASGAKVATQVPEGYTLDQYCEGMTVGSSTVSTKPPEGQLKQLTYSYPVQVAHE